MELHWEISKALAHTMDDQEKENIRINRRVTELEAARILWSLFAEPLSIVPQV